MLYYDRRLPADLVGLLQPNMPLAWLVDYVCNDDQTRIDFRRADGERRLGGIQVYRGRTSPVEVLGQASGQVKLQAHATYSALTPLLFGRLLNPANIHLDVRNHLAACAAAAPTAFTNGEGAIHNKLMRRYGMFHKTTDPLLAVDSEVRIGFRKDIHYRSGGDHQEAHKLDLEKALGLSGRQGHTKLDALGVTPDGDLALVEVKDTGGEIRVAAHQLAAHLYTFGVLLRQDGDKLAEVINGMIEQKIACGLLPYDRPIPRVTRNEVVAVIAAPDKRSEWKSIWEGQVGDVLKNVPGVKYSVRFWRLSSSGEVDGEHRL